MAVSMNLGVSDDAFLGSNAIATLGVSPGVRLTVSPWERRMGSNLELGVAEFADH